MAGHSLAFCCNFDILFLVFSAFVSSGIKTHSNLAGYRISHIQECDIKQITVS